MCNPNDPAFPGTYDGLAGLTKREWYAGLVLIARHIVPMSRLSSDYVREAVEMADALIAELNKSEEKK